MSIELPGFESNLVKFEIPIGIKKAVDEKIEKILNYMSTKELNEHDEEIIKTILETCRCHKYSTSRLLRKGSFELYPKTVIINSHTKEDD